MQNFVSEQLDSKSEVVIDKDWRWIFYHLGRHGKSLSQREIAAQRYCLNGDDDGIVQHRRGTTRRSKSVAEKV